MDHWRLFLYPLGFISSLLFGARIFVQWISSEIKQKSVVPRLFWQLSFFGNLFLMMHSLIQVQYHVFIIQVCNAVISWRNLNFSGKQEAINVRYVILFLMSAICCSSLLFLTLNSSDLSDFSSWFRIPSWNNHGNVNIIWHIVGFIGLTLFSSRFWFQWIASEKAKTSTLGPYFWWISLIGDLLVLVYFAKIKDPVNLIGPIFGLIPYIRNLILIKKLKKLQEA